MSNLYIYTNMEHKNSHNILKYMINLLEYYLAKREIESICILNTRLNPMWSPTYLIKSLQKKLVLICDYLNIKNVFKRIFCSW